MRIGATAALLLALVPTAWGLEFASTQQPAILYDAPSSAADKIAVVSPGYPLEKLVTAAGWTKVRDETGKLAWIEDTALGDKRTVLVTAPEAQILERPEEGARLSFRAARGVVLELLPGQAPGWAMVRHATGRQGFVRIREVWGL